MSCVVQTCELLCYSCGCCDELYGTSNVVSLLYVCRARQKRMEEQLKQAAEPRSSFPRRFVFEYKFIMSFVNRCRPSRESGSISASTKHIVDPTAVYPSIMPDRVFFSTVRNVSYR